MDNKYKIIRVLNNNVILAKQLSNNAQVIFVGKGIGFGKKSGEVRSIPKDSIEKSFVTYDGKLKRDYLRLIEQMDEEVLSMCTEIIIMAEERLGELNSRIHIVLTDHIGFALERIKAGMEIHNPFLHEIKSLYQKEYQVGLQAQAIIEKTTGIRIVEDEVGFIALHMNAARKHKDVKDSLRNTRLIKELVSIIENSLDYKIKSDLTYSRLIHHLRGSIERIEKGQTIKNPLIDMLRKEFKDSFKIAGRIKVKIEDEIDAIVPDDELGYMAIHIDRIRRMAKQQLNTDY